MLQQLEGCVGWVYVRGRCAFSDFSLSLSKFNAISCLALYLPRAAFQLEHRMHSHNPPTPWAGPVFFAAVCSMYTGE